MSNKKIMALAILIVSLLAVSAVSAADNGIDGVVGVEKITDELSIKETADAVSLDNANQAIAENEIEFHSFDELNSLINSTPEGGELILDYNYRYDGGSVAGISIDKPMTIDGNEHMIDGNQSSWIFRVNANNVVLKNFVFMNGQSDGDGGAISWLGDNGTVMYSSFESNNALQYGGAIYWFGDCGTVIRSSFSDNNASKFAGAVYWCGDDGLLDGSTFENNYAPFAGAIQCLGNNVSVEDCTFMKNIASEMGSAIQWQGSEGTVADSRFENNNASNYGGTIFWMDEDGTIRDSSFTNNSAACGGAILFSFTANLTVEDCNFTNNIASNYGGAISSIYNQSEFDEGKVYMATISITDSVFISNAAAYGGAICWNGAESAVKDSIFRNNSAAYGGAICWNGAESNLGGSIFTNNTADYGGAVLLAHPTNLTVENCNFTENIASEYGGAISSIYNQSDFNESNVFKETINITDSHFINNVADYGGAICWNCVDSTISESIFINNSAFHDGGAIFWKGSNGIVSDSNFADNCATDCGGAICLDATYTAICDSSFTNNNAALGGAIYSTNDNSDNSRVSDCNFTGNGATINGGAINWDSNNGVLSGSSFINNTARYYSGAVFWNDDYGGRISDSVFKGNKAEKTRNIHSYSPLTFENLTLETDVAFDQITDCHFNSSATINFTFDDGCDLGGYSVKLLNGSEEISTFEFNWTYVYSYTWNNLAVGNYSFTAVETNDKGNIYSAKYEPMEFEVYKADSQINISPIVYVEFKENVTVNFYVVNRTNVTYVVETDSGEIVVNTTLATSDTIELQNLNAGCYTITIANSENDNYLGCEESANFTVLTASIALSIDADDVVYPDVANVIINASVAGDYKLYIGGDSTVVSVVVNETETGSNKVVSIDRVLQAGDHVAFVTSDIPNYSTTMASCRFNVLKGFADINVTVQHDSNVAIIDLPSDATGEVNVSVDTVNVYTGLANETRIVGLGNLTVGPHVMDVKFFNDKNYNYEELEKEFIVIKSNSSVSASSIECVEGDVAVLLVNVTNGASGVVLVDVEGFKFYGDIDHGSASVSIVGLVAGNYTAEIAYPGNDRFNPSNTSANVKVEAKPASKVESSIAFVLISDNNVTGILKDSEGNGIANAEVEIIADGDSKNVVTGDDGSFVFEAQNDVPVTIVYAGDNSTEATNATVTVHQSVPVIVKTESHFDIPNRSITINGYAVDTKAGEEGIYYATTLLDDKGNPIANAYIEFAVNNKIYNRTTYANGSFAPYKLNMIRAGRYTMAFDFAGDDNYTHSFATVCVDLDKKPIKIKASNKSYKASTKTKKYAVTLSTIVGSSHDGKAHLRSGLEVTLQVNGKTYTGVTDKNGKITYKITNLKNKAKYKAKISYEGDNTYESATKTVTLTVK